MKNLSTVIKIAACALLLSSASHAADLKRVGIAQFGLAPQLDEIVTSLKSELASEGFVEGKSITFEYDQVNFDTSLVPQLLTKLSGSSPDVIVTITTPVSQAAKQILSGSNIPVVFSAVTDPVAANLVPSWNAGSEFMTGASDLQDAALVMDFVRKLLPDAMRLAIPFNPGEDNDRAVIDNFKAAASKFGFEIVDVGIDNTSDIPVRIASLQGKADVIYVGGSNLIQPAFPAVSAAARAIGIPIVNSDSKPVKDGLALASYAVDYTGVGRATGKLIGRILNGEKAVSIATAVPGKDSYETVISQKALDELHVSLPAALVDCGCIVP